MTKRSDIFSYAKKRYGIDPDYPFEKYPDYAVLRQCENEKWFCLVMNVDGTKLGLEGGKEIDVIDVIDVKCPPAQRHDLLRLPGYKPAYHMNKEHWITVLLNGAVSQDDIFQLIDQSFELVR